MSGFGLLLCIHDFELEPLARFSLTPALPHLFRE